MITVFFYSFILFSSTFFVWLSERCWARLDRLLLLSAAFFLVFIPAAIRYDVGTDYFSYLKIFENSLELEKFKHKEPAFYFINWLLNTIDTHFQWMFATYSFIFTAIAFKTYSRNNAWLLHFLFFASLWLFSFSGLRQSIALAWCLLAMFLFFEKRYIWFFILTIVASSFHQSALFITAAGLSALIPFGDYFKTRIAPIAFLSFIIFTYFSMRVVLPHMEHALNMVGFTNYANYFSDTRHFINRDFGSGIGVLAKVLFSIYIIINTKVLIKTNKSYWLLIILTFAYATGVVLASNIIIFNRMAATFVIAPIIGAFLLYQLPKNRYMHRFVLVMFLIFLTLSFIKTSFGTVTNYSNPNLNPYRTILELDNNPY